MAENLIDLRRRIKSVRNTQKITRAMKTVSASKLRRSVMELYRIRPMMEKIGGFLKRIGNEVNVDSIPFLNVRESGEWVIVVVSSDKGFCGAFNSNLIKKAEEHFHKLQEGEIQVSIVTVGNKVTKHFKKLDYPIRKEYTNMMSRLQYSNALELSEYLQALFLKENIKKIEFINTEFLSASKQQLCIKQLFPLKSEWEKLENQGEEEAEDVEYIFEPSPLEIFESLLPKYINSFVYRILAESSSSEHSARMIAMELATNNASEMIRNLTLVMNKLRQASITNELLEIITATEALRK
jgi:F-type H+-transporting ATPase subunit gamma